MNLFGSFTTSIVAFSFAGKPAGRSYRWATLLTSKNANRRSQTSLLLSYDCAELASLDSNCSLAILRRFLQRAYFLECEPEASFLLSKVSYSYILILVALLLTLRLFPGSSLSADLRTSRHFTLLVQESSLPSNCALSTSINLLNPFGPFATSIVALGFACKPARRLYHWASLLRSGNTD